MAILDKLKAFQKAAQELNMEWMKNEDEDLENLLAQLYPFQTSFDDLTIDIEYWVEDVKNKFN